MNFCMHYNITDYENISGFLAYLALNKDLDECARAGLYCVYENLQQLGCQYPPEVNYNPDAFFQTEED